MISVKVNYLILSNKCPKCGHKSIAGPHRVHGGNSPVKIDLPGHLKATLDAFTCAGCGYTEFYADDLGVTNIRSSGRFIESPIQMEPVRNARSEKPSEPEKCKKCGNIVSLDDKFCLQCGNKL
ncbi:MAG: zinc-ribbon domain-containing protein [Candidatus Hodarchaeales archaeon]|jgi:predicted nucleic-acid-binding Zn-ribbon protein